MPAVSVGIGRVERGVWSKLAEMAWAPDSDQVAGLRGAFAWPMPKGGEALPEQEMSAEMRRVAETTYDAVTQLMYSDAAAGWQVAELATVDPSLGIKVTYRLMDASSWAVKTVAMVPASADEVLRVMVDPERNAHWYDPTRNRTTVRRYRGGSFLMRTRLDTAPGTGLQLDALALCTNHALTADETDNTGTSYMCCMQSVEDPDFPVPPGTVRVAGRPGAWMVQPRGVDAAGLPLSLYTLVGGIAFRSANDLDERDAIFSTLLVPTAGMKRYFDARRAQEIESVRAAALIARAAPDTLHLVDVSPALADMLAIDRQKLLHMTLLDLVQEMERSDVALALLMAKQGRGVPDMQVTLLRGDDSVCRVSLQVRQPAVRQPIEVEVAPLPPSS